MNKKMLILFDLDDTLCDYQKAKEAAFEKINEYLIDIKINCEDYWVNYKSIEKDLFNLFLEGRLEKNEYRIKRFLEPLRVFDKGDVILAERLNNIYVNSANIDIELFPEVEETLNMLSSIHDLVILTNGPTDGQKLKIESLGIKKWFKGIYISEDLGYAKPDSRVFSFVLDREGYERNNTIMVGDSIKYDLEGAINFGIKAIHVDRGNNKLWNGLRINTLKELEKHLV